MAVDTAERRYSAVNPAIPWWGSVIPEGTVSSADRRAARRLYSGLAAGNAYSIVAEFGSFAMTGYDATLTPTVNINTAQKRFAAINLGLPWRGLHTYPTGTIGRTQRGTVKNFYIPYQVGATYTITCDAGAFVWDGEPAFSDLEVTAQAGTFAMTGNSATLIATRTLFATAGTFTMTGNDANLNYFIVRTLTGTSGSFVMTGSDAVFNRPRSIEASAGSFGMGGYPITLQWINGSGEVIPLPRSRRAVSGVRKHYIYKGRRYHLTPYELRRLIEEDATRDEIKVLYKNQKPHKISKAALEEVMSIEVDTSDDEDLEDIIALL